MMSLVRTLFVSGFFVSSLLAGPIYNVVLLPIPAGWGDNHPTGINNSGQMIGNGANPSLGCGAQCQGFIATASTFNVIELPQGYTGNRTTDINNLGQVVGFAAGQGNGSGFIATVNSTTIIPLNSPNFFSSPAYGVNDSGAIVGDVFDGSFQAYLGNASGFSEITHSPPWTDPLFSEDINNAGQILGYGWNNSSYQVFLDDNTGFHLVPLPNGTRLETSRRLKENDFGDVVGLATDTTTFLTYTFLHTQSGTIIIGPGGGNDTVGPSINNLDQVVDGSQIWDSVNGLRDLNNLVGGGWQIDETGGINDNGQIAATAANPSLGLFDVPVILDPVPEPSTSLLVFPGVLGLIGWRVLKTKLST
jgi:hypothetical protein